MVHFKAYLETNCSFQFVRYYPRGCCPRTMPQERAFSRSSHVFYVGSYITRQRLCATAAFAARLLPPPFTASSFARLVNVVRVFGATHLERHAVRWK